MKQRFTPKPSSLLAVALVAITSGPIAELGSSEAPLALIYQRAAGTSPILISTIAMAAMVQASQALPQIKLQISCGMVQAIGVTGLIYGRHTNII